MKDSKEIVKLLVEWFDENKRDLPWRNEVSPYRVWISEIMLQQTRVEAVKPYFERFIQALPDVESLAEISEDELLKLWQGLGYYSRAKNLKKAAIIIMEEYAGEFPKTKEKLETLPGIGSYTSGAIASMAFSEAVPAVDGNVLRVMSRLVADTSDISSGKVKKQWEEKMQEIIPTEYPGKFNQALMDLGAMVCVPAGVPKCDICPLSKFCAAKKSDQTATIPYKKPKKARRIENKTVFLIRDDGEIIMKKRPKTGLLAGLYEFPNVEGTKEKPQVLSYMKKLGIEIVHIQKLPKVKHIFSHVEWHMQGYLIKVDELSKPIQLSAGLILVDYEAFTERIPLPTAFSYYNDFIWTGCKLPKKI